MFRNYLKIAYRTLLKNKAYTLLNVAGLSLGLASALLIFALVRYHYNIDKHHPNADNIYRITSTFITPDGNSNTTGVPYAFLKAIKTDYPQMAQATMIEELNSPTVMIEDKGQIKKFKGFGKEGNRGAFAEPAFFKIFDYSFVAGDYKELVNPNTVVLSEATAEKYFGTSQCLGKTFKLEGRILLKVVGVFKNYQDNTDFRFQMIPSYATVTQLYGGPLDTNFGNTNSSSQCFVLLNDKFTKADWDKQLVRFVKKYRKDPDAEKTITYPMTALKENHFSKDINNSVDKKLILSLFVIGLFLIITACINFVNLATAQALKRSKEVGVRKVLGSTKSQLFWQFIAETTIITVVSTAIALLLFRLAQPIIQQNLTGIFNFTFYFTPDLVLYLILIVVGVVVFSGVYPSMILGSFQPVMALKGKISTQQLGGFSVRRGLVILQFAISQMLIIGMLVVANQLNFFTSKDLGFKQEAIITVQLPFVDQQDITKMNTFRNLATSISDVEKLSYSMSGAPQSGWVSSTSIVFNNRPKNEDFSCQVKQIDDKYLDMYGIKLVAGRNVLRADTAREALINESLVKKLGMKTPNEALNKILDAQGSKMNIVGVIKDFHMSDLSSSIAPLYMTTRMNSCYFANVKLRTGNFQNAIKSLQKAYDQVYPNDFFEPNFVDEQIAENYQNEVTMGRLVNFFALVAILIGCLGLYGLVSFMAAQKTKEIGIRKVLGASVPQILGLFGKEFGLLIVIAFAVAAPLGWFVMNKWLQNYQYRIDIGVGVFLLAIGTTVIIALLTVGYRSLKAAWANPITSLRTE
jgi:putative ABC transport system permease protein